MSSSADCQDEQKMERNSHVHVWTYLENKKYNIRHTLYLCFVDVM